MTTARTPKTLRGRTRRVPDPILIEGDVGRVPLTNGGWALIDAADAEFVGQWCWSAHCPTGGKHTYVVRHRFVDEPPGPQAIRLHRELMRPGEGLVVDHRNGDGLDCRRENMRVCTPQQNHMNMRARVGRELPKGVTAMRRRFRATITLAGVTHSLGGFATVEEAAAAYARAAVRLHGEFANIPSGE